MNPFIIHLLLSFALPSGMEKLFQTLGETSCSKLEISHFSKVLWFFVVGKYYVKP